MCWVCGAQFDESKPIQKPLEKEKDEIIAEREISQDNHRKAEKEKKYKEKKIK